MDVDALVNFVRGWLGAARLVAALRREYVALEALRGQELSQVGQVLRRRGVVGPVVLVDEEDSPGAALDLCGRAGDMRPGKWALWRVEGRLPPNEPADLLFARRAALSSGMLWRSQRRSKRAPGNAVLLSSGEVAVPRRTAHGVCLLLFSSGRRITISRPPGPCWPDTRRWSWPARSEARSVATSLPGRASSA